MSTYIGLWINWSHGRVLGSTITLSARDGGLLTSFLAIFVSTAGAAFWAIVSFWLHQHFSRTGPQDGIHQQRQVILRNTSSPAGAAWQLLQLSWAWRNNAEKSFSRSLPSAIVALLTLGLFALAGIFSSEVTKAAGNETILISPSCGTFVPGNASSDPTSLQWRKKTVNDTKTALSYARDCYGIAQNPLNCNQYIQQRLTWKVNQNASCPFSDDICIGHNTAYEMDTGPIDSHRHLGINTPGSQRLSYRKVTTCSPLATKGFLALANNTNSGAVDEGDLLQYFYYGPTVGPTNYTYMYDTHSAFLSLGYTLNTITTVGSGTNDRAWLPVPALARTDADVSIFFLAPNSVEYSGPVQDPFFTATTESNVTAVDGSNRTYYDSDYFVSVLACTDQHQYCAQDKCTPLTASEIALNETSKLGLNPMQVAIKGRLGIYSLSETLFWSVYALGSDALRASDTLFDLTQVPLPDNQWTVEVSSWMATSMARLQQLAVQYATGPLTVTDKSLVLPPQTAEDKSMCRSQKVRSASGTTSFSVLGVAIILVVGTILLTLSLLLSTIVSGLRRVSKYKDHKWIQYLLDEKLQLHRLAYEGAGQGNWSNCADSIPITREGERLGIPEMVDKDHPRLARSLSHSSTNVRNSEGSWLIGGKHPYTTTEASSY